MSAEDSRRFKPFVVNNTVAFQCLKCPSEYKSMFFAQKHYEKVHLGLDKHIKLEHGSVQNETSSLTHVENSSETKIKPKVFMSEEDHLKFVPFYVDFTAEKHLNFLNDHTYCANILSDRSKQDTNTTRNLPEDENIQSLRCLKILKITQKRKKLFVSFGSNENLAPPSMPILKPFPELPAEDTSTCLPREVSDEDLEELEVLDEEEEELDPLDVKIERPSISHQSSPIHMENSSETWNGLDNVKNSESDDLDQLDNVPAIFLDCQENKTETEITESMDEDDDENKTETKESMDKDDEWKGAQYANRSIKNRNRRKREEEKIIADRIARNAKTSSKVTKADIEQNNDNVIRKSVRIRRPKPFHFESKRTDNINMEPIESIKDDGSATFMDCHQEIKTEIEIKEEPLYDHPLEL